MSRLYKCIASIIIGIMATFVSCRVWAEVYVPKPKLARSIPVRQDNQATNIVLTRLASRAYPWEAGKEYSAGDIAIVAGSLFVCLRPHTAETSSAPAASTNHWRTVKTAPHQPLKTNH